MENKKIKIYVVGNSTYYASFIKNYELVDDIKDANLVLFTGGEDVYPGLYKCKKHPRTFYNKSRDDEEVKIFNSIREDQFVLGICRGFTLAHVKQGELSGTLKCKPAAKPVLKNIWKVQRLGIETKFGSKILKYVSNIPKSALSFITKI